MARKTFAMKRDLNEPEIVEELKARGFVVFRIDAPCDLLVWCKVHLRWMCFEVKDPKRPKRLTSQQVIDHTRSEIWILTSKEQVGELAHHWCEFLAEEARRGGEA